MIIVLIVAWRNAREKEIGDVKYFLSSYYIKILGAFSFGLVYILLFDGGDTKAYWDGAIILNNLFWESPSKFVNEMMQSSDLALIRNNFTPTTGYPPGWIYRESESFIVSKVFVFFSFITFKSYWAATLLIGFVSAEISWRFYRNLAKLNMHMSFIEPFAILFLPTIAFWSSGISKDSLVFLAFLVFTNQLISIYYLKAKLNFKTIAYILLALLFIIKIRIYILVAIFVALLIAYTRVVEEKNKSNRIRKLFIKFIFYGLGIGVLLIFMRLNIGSSSLNQLFEEIVTIQKDFAGNVSYGGERYDLEIGDDYSLRSVLLSLPQALTATFYRPFIWEANKPILLFNGIENLIILILSIYFLLKSPLKKINAIRKSEFHLFAFVFILIMGFSIGFTSVLFGVLVRMKAMILPFFILLIGISVNKSSKISDASTV